MSSAVNVKASHYADEAAVADLEQKYKGEEVVGQRRATRAMLGIVPGEEVLDVGCGPGLLSTEIAVEVGASGRVCGIDASPAMIKRALIRLEEEALPHVDFSVGSALSLPFQDGSFDAIVCVQVLSYVPEPEAALREMKRVLRDDGRVLIVDTDWRTRLVATANSERMARVLSAIDRGFGFADTQLPPKLPSLARAAGLRAVDTRAFPLTRVGSFDSGSYFDLTNCTKYVEGIGLDELSAWAEEQHALSREGSFFFSCTRTMMLLRATPPSSPAAKRQKREQASQAAPSTELAPPPLPVMGAAECADSGAARPAADSGAAPGLAIRAAEEKDCATIATLWNEYIETSTVTFNPTSKTAGDVRAWRLAKHEAGEPLLCAVLDGQLVGFATYGTFRGGLGYRHTVEHTVYVARQSWRHGVGRALLAAIEHHAADSGAHVMVGGLSSENETALAFHLRAGYVETGRLPEVGTKFGRWLGLVLVQKTLKGL